MAATTLGTLSHLPAIGPEQRNAVPLKTATSTTSAGGTSASDAGASTITANDFLTLLVTELKNQDPTANTDPNEYVNQLVQVNSLQQLISINQTLIADSRDLPSYSAASAGPPTIDSGTIALNQTQRTVAPATLIEAPSAQISASGSVGTRPEQNAVGNFSIPAPNPSAQRVAQALSGAR